MHTCGNILNCQVCLSALKISSYLLLIKLTKMYFLWYHHLRIATKIKNSPKWDVCFCKWTLQFSIELFWNRRKMSYIFTIESHCFKILTHEQSAIESKSHPFLSTASNEEGSLFLPNLWVDSRGMAVKEQNNLVFWVWIVQMLH